MVSYGRTYFWDVLAHHTLLLFGVKLREENIFSSWQVGCFQNKLQEAYWNWKKCSPALLSSFCCLFCAFNNRALCLFSCAIHFYIFYPREKSHSELVLRLHNALQDMDKSHFVRGLSRRIWKARDYCIFSTDFVHQTIILVSSVLPSHLLLNLQYPICDLMETTHQQPLGLIYVGAEVFSHLLKNCMC